MQYEVRQCRLMQLLLSCMQNEIEAGLNYQNISSILNLDKDIDKDVDKICYSKPVRVEIRSLNLQYFTEGEVFLEDRKTFAEAFSEE